MKTAFPLLVSLAEASFQLGIPVEDVQTLIKHGELPTVEIERHVLVPYDALVKLVRKAVSSRAIQQGRKK